MAFAPSRVPPPSALCRPSHQFPCCQSTAVHTHAATLPSLILHIHPGKQHQQPPPCELSLSNMPLPVIIQHGLNSSFCKKTSPSPQPAPKVTPWPCRQLGEQEVAMTQHRAARRSPGEAAGLKHTLVTAGCECPCREDLAYYCPPSTAASGTRAPGQLSLQTGCSHQVKPRQEDCCNF